MPFSPGFTVFSPALRTHIITSQSKTSLSSTLGFRCFFFFQAEDGIRDIGVTGVQTCALPIFEDYGYEVAGIRRGWKGLLDPESDSVEPLTVDDVRYILQEGGTMLLSSRTNPYKNEGDAEKVVENLGEFGVDALVAIGGDDTLGVAKRLFDDFGVQVVGCPKTIDNDLSATDTTFGYDTAVSIATEAIDRIRTTAKSHERIIVVEVMGRHAEIG